MLAAIVMSVIGDPRLERLKQMYEEWLPVFKSMGTRVVYPEGQFTAPSPIKHLRGLVMKINVLISTSIVSMVISNST